jgi:hypothetical protein
VPAADYRFGELILVKPLLAALGLAKLTKVRLQARGTRPGGRRPRAR